MGGQVDLHSYLPRCLTLVGSSPSFPAVGLLMLQLFHTSTAETGPTNSQCKSSLKPQRNHAGCMGHCGWGNKSGQGSWACFMLGLVCAGSTELMVAGTLV